jgi:hypothetical protein
MIIDAAIVKGKLAMRDTEAMSRTGNSPYKGEQNGGLRRCAPTANLVSTFSTGNG